MKENNARVHSDPEKIKGSEAITEHVTSLTNKEHEPVSITPNRIYFNIEYYEKVYRLIPKGRRNAVSMSELSKQLHINDRQCRKLISKMRTEKSYLIIGDSAGYYKPATNRELYDWYRSVKARAMTSLESLKYARRIMKGNGIDLTGTELIQDVKPMKED